MSGKSGNAVDDDSGNSQQREGQSCGANPEKEAEGEKQSVTSADEPENSVEVAKRFGSFAPLLNKTLLGDWRLQALRLSARFRPPRALSAVAGRLLPCVSTQFTRPKGNHP